MSRIRAPRRPLATARPPRLPVRMLELVQGYLLLGMLWHVRGGSTRGVLLLRRELRAFGFTGKYGMGRFRVAYEHHSGWWLKVPYHPGLRSVSARERVHYDRATALQRRHLPRTQWLGEGLMLQAPIRHLRRLQGALSRQWSETAQERLPQLTVDHHGGNVGLGTNGCVQWCDWGTDADMAAAWQALERAVFDEWWARQVRRESRPTRRRPVA